MRILHNNKPWETWFFQRGRDELLTGRWVSCCWVQRGMTHKVKFVCQGATSWITGIFLRGKIEIFTGGLVSSYVALKRKMQDEVEIVCQGATLWKMDIFLRGRVELFTGEWVSCCWVPKRDDAGESEICMPRCNALLLNVWSKKRKTERKKCLIPLLGRFTVKWWILLFSFSWFMKQHGTHDIEVTNNTRATRQNDGDEE